MELYSCAYDYCANVTGDSNSKGSDLGKPNKKTLRANNGTKQGNIVFLITRALTFNEARIT